jgi:aerobic carbon-monoxide dehydrogenase medium subunit
MKRPDPFEIYQPASIEEAREIHAHYGPGGYFLAGGTDLVIAIKEKGLAPRYVVDLKRIPSISGICENPADGSLVIGALTTMRELETSRVINKRFPFLSQSAAEVGSIQIRNRATIGGNIANATPSADVVPALLVLKAQVKIFSANGENQVPLESVFLAPGKTIMTPGDILTEIIIPPAPANLRGEYIKFSPREMMDLAYVGVAVAIVIEGNDKVCREAQIALGAVSPVPMRARKAEAVLIDHVINEEIAQRAGEIASAECSPISDVRASAEYRRHMVRVNTKRAILNAASGRPENLPWVARRERRY